MRLRTACLLSFATAVILAAVGVYSWTRGPVVTITNQSSRTLTDIELSGSGFSSAIGSLAPGKRIQRIVHPGGESSLQLKFVADGRIFDAGEMNMYFEDNAAYRISIMIDANLRVTANYE